MERNWSLRGKFISPGPTAIQTSPWPGISSMAIKQDGRHTGRHQSEYRILSIDIVHIF